MLAKLYFETGKGEQSKEVLTELLNLSQSIKYQKQAQNLYDYYSFN